MAKIRLGGLVQDVRGSQNGLTFSRNKGGAYVRQRVAPTNVSSEARTRQRNIFSAAAKKWSGSLDDAQRAAWTAFALANPITDIFGASVILSGLSMFVRLNSVLATVSAAEILTPPTDLIVAPQSLGLSVNFNALAQSVSIVTAAQIAQPTTKYYIFATGPVSVGTTPGTSAYRYIGAYLGVAAAATVDITDEFILKYSNVVEGMKYGVLVAQVNTTSGAVLAGQVFTGIGVV